MVVRSSMTGLLPSRDRTAEPSGLETAARRYRDRPTLLVNLVAIALPDHWFKDIFTLPGGALALVPAHDPFPSAVGWLLLALISRCWIASPNYTITNGWTPSSTGTIR